MSLLRLQNIGAFASLRPRRNLWLRFDHLVRCFCQRNTRWNFRFWLFWRTIISVSSNCKMSGQETEKGPLNEYKLRALFPHYRICFTVNIWKTFYDWVKVLIPKYGSEPCNMSFWRYEIKILQNQMISSDNNRTNQIKVSFLFVVFYIIIDSRTLSCDMESIFHIPALYQLLSLI